MHSQLLFGPTVVDGVRPELASAILEMLAICPRAMKGICGFCQPALMLRLSADEREVRAALDAMKLAGLIELVPSTSLIAQWQLRPIPEQRSGAVGIVKKLQHSRVPIEPRPEVAGTAAK